MFCVRRPPKAITRQSTPAPGLTPFSSLCSRVRVELRKAARSALKLSRSRWRGDEPPAVIARLQVPLFSVGSSTIAHIPTPSHAATVFTLAPWSSRIRLTNMHRPATTASHRLQFLMLLGGRPRTAPRLWDKETGRTSSRTRATAVHPTRRDRVKGNHGALNPPRVTSESNGQRPRPGAGS